MSDQRNSAGMSERKRGLIAVLVAVLAIWLLSVANPLHHRHTSHTAHASRGTASTNPPAAQPTSPTAGASDELDPDHRYCAQQVLSTSSGQPPLRCYRTSDQALAVATGRCSGCQQRWLLGIDYRDTHNQGDALYWYAASSCAGHRFLASVPASWINRISSATPAPGAPSTERCGHWIHYAASHTDGDSAATLLSGSGGRQLARTTASLDCGYLSDRVPRPPCRNFDLPGGGSLNDRTAIEEWH